MEVKIYKRKTDCAELLEAVTNSTDLVRVEPADYDLEPIVRQLDFESRIIYGAESIMSDINKVLGIVDTELWFQNHMYNIVNPGDIVEFSDHRFIKLTSGYAPVEIK